MYFLHMSKNLTKLLLVLIIISRDMFEQFCREYRYYSINYRRFRRSQHYEPEIDFVSACQLSYQIKNKALSNTNSEMMMLKWFLVDKIESKFYLLNTVLYQAEFIDNHIKNNLFFCPCIRQRHFSLKWTALWCYNQICTCIYGLMRIYFSAS